MDVQRLIAPRSAEVADYLVRAGDLGWIQTDKVGSAFMKVLWTSAQSGGWAVLYRWKKGFTAPPHKHLGAIHCMIISGRLKVGGNVLESGDYIYEANGMVHGTTEALEDTVHLNIADGPILFFSETGITGYAGWEQMREAAARAV